MRRMDPDNASEERKFSCHMCSKSFKKVLLFLSDQGLFYQNCYFVWLGVTPFCSEGRR
jgi:hypothetical protein